MAKVAVCIFGLVRAPKSVGQINRDDVNSVNEEAINWCAENIQIFKDCFKEHEVTTYFISWNCSSSIELVNRGIFDSSILMKQISEIQAEEIMKEKAYTYPRERFMGAYGLFMSMKQIFNFIKNSELEYDYVALSRPDQRLILDAESYMNDSYNTQGSVERVVDTFAVMLFKDAIKIWDYTIEELREAMKTNSDHEAVLGYFLRKNQVTIKPNLEGIRYNQFRERLVIKDGKYI